MFFTFYELASCLGNLTFTADLKMGKWSVQITWDEVKEMMEKTYGISDLLHEEGLLVMYKDWRETKLWEQAV